jgi:hypothetical protein
LIFDIENWHCKLDLDAFWQTHLKVSEILELIFEQTPPLWSCYLMAPEQRPLFSGGKEPPFPVCWLISKNMPPSFTLHYGATHGLRTPNEAFFHWNPELLGLGRQIEQINSGAFGVCLAKISAPILVQWVPCPCFSLFNHYFYKKLSLYIHIPNIYLGLGFELNLGRKELGI